MEAKLISRNNFPRKSFEEPDEDDEECDDDKWPDEYTHRFEELIYERDKAQDAHYTQLSSVEHQGEPEEIWKGNMIQELKHKNVEQNEGRYDTFLKKSKELCHEIYINILRETRDTQEPRYSKVPRVEHPDEQRVIYSFKQEIDALNNSSKEARVEHPDEQREIHSLNKKIEALNDNSKEPRVEHPDEQREIHSLNKKIEAPNDNSKMSCADCSKAIRVEDMTSLQRGQHITMPGEHFSHYSKVLGKRISLYQHHAIVKKIVGERSHHTAEVIVIHFYEDEKDKKIKVCEQKKEYNLRNDELYIIEYKHPRHDKDTIVQRAEGILNGSDNGSLFKYYNIFTKNCEHFATWCVIGQDESLQINSIGSDIKRLMCKVFDGGNIITRLLLKLFVDSSDEIASFATGALHIPSAVLGLSLAVHIIYCVYKTVDLIKRRYMKEKTICCHCLKERILDLWLQFGVVGVTSLITFVIVNFALPLLSPGVAIPIAVVLVLIGTALTCAFPSIRKALWSPGEYSTKEVKAFSEINVGDVVSLTYYGFAHLVVVSEVHMDPNPVKGAIQGIHYSLPTLFSRRRIANEKFPIELKTSKVSLVDFGLTSTFLPHEVVDRVRKRIGERKWKMSCNRSDHVCLWAVKKLDYNSEEIKNLEDKETNSGQSKKPSSLLVGKADIHLMNEIEPGDVVKYKSYKGIIVKLEDMKDGREFRMHLVIRKSCFNYYAKKVELKINLNKDCLTVYRYHPVHCVSKSDRVEKAVNMIGKGIKDWTQTGFIEDIILKKT